MARVATVWPRDVQQQQEQKKTQFFLGKKLDSSSEGSIAGLVFTFLIVYFSFPG